MKNRTLQLALSVAAVCFALSSHAIAVEIVLKQKIAPVKSTVTLGDIADIRAANGEDAHELALTTLWPAPPIGEQRFVSDRQVRDALVSHGFDDSELIFSGASRVAIGHVSTQAQGATDPRGLTRSPVVRPVVDDADVPSQARTGFRVPRDWDTPRPNTTLNSVAASVSRIDLERQMRAEAIAYLEMVTGTQGVLEIEFKLPARSLELQAVVSGEFIIVGGRAPWTGRQKLLIEYSSDLGTQQVPLYVDVFDTTPVLIATRPIARGQLLTAADVAVQTPPRSTRLASGRVPFYTLDGALGQEASRVIRAGEIVTADVCLPPMMIERGEIVTVLSAGGGISIRRNAKALSNARQGDVAEVELLNSRERLAARVVAPGELAMLGGGVVERRGPRTAKLEKPPAGSRLKDAISIPVTPRR